jgi:hypothetical protein
MLRSYKHNVTTPSSVRPLNLMVFRHRDKHGVDSTRPPGLVA